MADMIGDSKEPVDKGEPAVDVVAVADLFAESHRLVKPDTYDYSYANSLALLDIARSVRIIAGLEEA